MGSGEGQGVGRDRDWWAVVSPIAVHGLSCACHHLYTSVIVIFVVIHGRDR